VVERVGWADEADLTYWKTYGGIGVHLRSRQCGRGRYAGTTLRFKDDEVH